MSAHIDTWLGFCAVVAAYRRKYNAWPNRAMVPRGVLSEIKRHLGTSGFATVTLRLTIFPGDANRILIYDEYCQIVDDSEGVTPDDIAGVQQWLGIR